MTETPETPVKLGQLVIDVTAVEREDASLPPFDVHLTSDGNMPTRVALVALISSLGMIVEEVVRSGVEEEYKEVIYAEEIGDIQDIILTPLMELLSNNLSIIESSLTYVMTQISGKTPDETRELFSTTKTEETENVGDNPE